MKKLLLFITCLFTLFVMSASSLISFAATLPEQIRVIHNQTRIYSTTDLSEIEMQDTQAVTIAIANLHDVFDVVSEQGDFYEINILDTTGFVLKVATIDNSLKSPEKFLQTNAHILTDTSVYEKINNEYVLVENKTLLKDTQVRLNNGYDNSVQYTYISYDDNGQISNYYVLTAHVKSNGLDRSVLLAISLIIISVSVGGILMRIFKKNKINNKV